MAYRDEDSIIDQKYEEQISVGIYHKDLNV